METIVISDVHIGHKDCRWIDLLKVLKNNDNKRLIIGGDLFENCSRVIPTALTAYLNGKADKTIIDGNHDPKELGLVKRIFRKKVFGRYEWELNGKKICVLHGHQFDRMCFVFSEPLIDQIFTFFIDFFKRINIKDYFFRRVLDFLHEKFSSHMTEKIKNYAIKHKIDVIICGHTHLPLHLSFCDKNGRKIEYLNCGCWIDDICAYVLVNEKAEATLCFVKSEN